MATDGVKYSEFTPLPAGQLAGNENFVGLKNGVNVRLEGDWRGAMADLLRPPLMGTAPADIDAGGYSNVSFLSTGGTGTVSADRNNAAFLGNDGLVTITLDAAAGRVEARELMIGGELILFPQNNLTATANPGVNDDASEGYSVLSKWINTSDGEVFVCVDATGGAAVWQQTTVDADDLGNLAFINGSTVGINLAQLSTPGAASWARVNSDGTVSLRTAAQTLSDLGGSGGSGDLTTGDIATPAEARAGTAGKILDAAGGHAMVAQWGIGRLVANPYPLSDVDADPTGVPDGWYRAVGISNLPFGVNSYLHVWHLNASSLIVTAITHEGALRYGVRRWIGSGWASTWEQGEAWTASNLKKVTSNSDTTASSLTTVEWVQANAGGGGGGFKTAPVQVFTSADQVGNNITVNLDCSANNFFQLDFSDGTISTSGTITLNLTNYPTATSDVVYGHIAAVRLGRKTAVNITCAGKTVSWIATPSGFRTSTTGMDNIHFYTMPLNPSKLLLSLNDGRPTGYM